jgi:hypothetical protein
VTFDALHQRKTHCKRDQVPIDLAVPDGAEVVVDCNHEKDGGHEDPQVVIRDAFGAAEHQLKTFVAEYRIGGCVNEILLVALSGVKEFTQNRCHWPKTGEEHLAAPFRQINHSPVPN